jgi:hypothetical protein
LAGIIYPTFPGGPVKAFFVMALVIVIVYILSSHGGCSRKEQTHRYPDPSEAKMSLKGIFEKVFKNDHYSLSYSASSYSKQRFRSPLD